MVKSVHIQNFKCLGDVHVDLEPLTVVIGKNDTGKSSFLEAIAMLAPAPPQGVFGSAHKQYPRDILKRGAATSAIEITAHLTDGVRSTVKLPPPNRAIQIPGVDNGHFIGVQPPYRFDLDKLRAPAFVGQLQNRALPSDGESLAAAVDRLSYKRFTKLQDALISRIPLVRELQAKPYAQQQGMKEIWFEVEGAGLIPAREMSDGVMLVLATLTVLHDENAPKLIMLEEPETGIHPKQLERLVEAFISLVDEGVQILLTTHSPYLLDFVPKESVRVFARDEHAEVTVKPLSNISEIRDMVSKGFTLGEAWYNSDEDVLIRGKENARSTT